MGRALGGGLRRLWTAEIFFDASWRLDRCAKALRNAEESLAVHILFGNKEVGSDTVGQRGLFNYFGLSIQDIRFLGEKRMLMRLQCA